MAEHRDTDLEHMREVAATLDDRLQGALKYGRRMAARAAAANRCLQLVIDDKRRALDDLKTAREWNDRYKEQLQELRARDIGRAHAAAWRRSQDTIDPVEKAWEPYQGRAVVDMTEQDLANVMVIQELRATRVTLYELREQVKAMISEERGALTKLKNSL